MDLTYCVGVNRIQLDQDKGQRWAFEDTVTNLLAPQIMYNCLGERLLVYQEGLPNDEYFL